MAAILHKVKRYETLLSICLEYNLEYHRLVDLNLRFLNLDLLDNGNIRPGMQLVIGDSADPIDLVRVMHRRT